MLAATDHEARQHATVGLVGRVMGGRGLHWTVSAVADWTGFAFLAAMSGRMTHAEIRERARNAPEAIAGPYLSVLG
jgi:hypothetical protein